MKRISKRFVNIFTACIIVSSTFMQNVSAYSNDDAAKNGPHREINRIALNWFIQRATIDPIFKNYVFKARLADFKLKIDNNKEKLLTPEYEGVTVSGAWENAVQEELLRQTFETWVIEGGYSADEPNLYMSLRHFYDVEASKNNKPAYLTDDLDSSLSRLFTGDNPQMNAKQWAIEDSKHSYKNGQSALAYAFNNKSSRDSGYYFGKAWRSLGETMHLIADMTVPAHVRNDSHPDAIGENFLGLKIENYLNLKGDPYELYVKADTVKKYAALPVKNKTLISNIQKANNPDELFNIIAQNTSNNYFSTDTVSGIDYVTKNPITNFNGKPAYKLPLLNNYTYDSTTKYYVTKDTSKTPIIKRNDDGRHLVDDKVADAQAKELIPVAIEANAKLIDMYMPRIKVNVNSFDSKKKLLKCSILRYDNKMKPISSGTIFPKAGNKIMVYSSAKNKYYYLPVVNTINGKFDVVMSDICNELSNLKVKSTNVTVNMDMGGILVKSNTKGIQIYTT